MRKLLGFIVAILVVVPSVAGAVPVRLDNQGVGLQFMSEPISGSWDVSSLVDSPDTFNANDETGFSHTNRGVDYGDEGSKIYLTTASDSTHVFEIVNKPYDIDEGVNYLYSVTWDTGFKRIHFSDNGDTVIAYSRSVDEGTIFELSTSFDLRTRTIVKHGGIESDNAGVNDQPHDFWINDSGDSMFLVYRSDLLVESYTLSAKHDPFTATQENTLDISSELSDVRGLAVKPDGKILYVPEYSNSYVSQWDMSTNYDLNSATFSDSFTPSPPAGGEYEITYEVTWRQDNGGSYIQIDGNNSDGRVYQFPIQ